MHNSCTEFHENATNGLVDDTVTGARSDGRRWSPHTHKRFIHRKGHLNLNSCNGSFWNPNSPSVSQEISLILWNLKDHSRVRNSLQPVTYLTHRNPVHTNLSYFCRANLNITSHVRLSFPNDLSDIPIKTLYASLFSSMRGTRPTHNVLDVHLDWHRRHIYNYSLTNNNHAQCIRSNRCTQVRGSTYNSFYFTLYNRLGDVRKALTLLARPVVCYVDWQGCPT